MKNDGGILNYCFKDIVYIEKVYVFCLFYIFIGKFTFCSASLELFWHDLVIAVSLTGGIFGRIMGNVGSPNLCLFFFNGGHIKIVQKGALKCSSNVFKITRSVPVVQP